MKNKCFLALLMVVVMMCACWTGAVAEDECETFTSGDYEYALLDDGTIEITKYNGSADHLAIPATLDGKTVTAIGDYTFARCSSLTFVSIPDSVTSIGDYAFGDCSNLTLTVYRNSYALEYAKTNNIPYTYPDANDWLNN